MEVERGREMASDLGGLSSLGGQEKKLTVMGDDEEGGGRGGLWHLTRRENQKVSPCETLTSLML